MPSARPEESSAGEDAPVPAGAENGTGVPRRRRFRAEIVYDELRDRILRGQLQAGQPLVEERLAEEFETSRTPVREALRRLEGDGYLARGPGGSLIPALPDVEEMGDFYELRVVIEELSVRRATLVGDRARLLELQLTWEGFRDELAAGDTSMVGLDFVYTDESFHRGVASIAGSPPLSRILTELNDRIRTLRIRDFSTTDRVEATISEHLEIVETILLGDADAAAAFMRAHVQRSALIVRRRAAATLARMSTPPVAG